jgi:hypothetical protein
MNSDTELQEIDPSRADQVANVASYVERLRLYGGVPPAIQREVADILEYLLKERDALSEALGSYDELLPCDCCGNYSASTADTGTDGEPLGHVQCANCTKIATLEESLQNECDKTARDWVQRDEALRRIGSLEAKLEQSEHNCDMLLRYIDQALRDARQLQASLDDWKAETPQDADTHRFRSTRAYQVVKSLETAFLKNKAFV